MATALKSLSETFWSYVTPRKTPTRHATRSVTPSINVNGKRVFTPDSTTKPRKKVLITPSTTDDDNAEYEHEWSDDPPEEDDTLVEHFDGDTMVGEATPISKTTGSEKLLAQFESPENKRRLAKDNTIIRPDKAFDEADHKKFEIDKAWARRLSEAQGMRDNEWAEDPIKVYLKLAMRGWEPILPGNWLHDFETFPLVLFAKKTEQEYIKPVHGSDFRAIKALRSLIHVGSRARDSLAPGVITPPLRQPEELIRREVDAYTKWAYADGQVDSPDDLPVLAVISGSKDVPAKLLEAAMISRLGALKAEWEDALRAEPTTEGASFHGSAGPDSSSEPASDAEFICKAPDVYGIVISYTMMAFVAYEDEGLDEPRIRIIATFNYQHAAYDVWTAIAIAIFIMHCRYRMMELQETMDAASGKQSTSSNAG